MARLRTSSTSTNAWLVFSQHHRTCNELRRAANVLGGNAGMIKCIWCCGPDAARAAAWQLAGVPGTGATQTARAGGAGGGAERLGDQPGQLYEILATVRFLGPGGSWDGLGVVRYGLGGPTWPLGRWVRWPVWPVALTRTGAGSSAPPPYRRLPAGDSGTAGPISPNSK
jgi:hypothetical protein